MRSGIRRPGRVGWVGLLMLAVAAVFLSAQSAPSSAPAPFRVAEPVVDPAVAAAAAEAAIYERLRQPGPAVQFKGVSLEKALEEFGRLTQLGLVVNWDDLTENGISRDREVSLTVNGVSAEMLLRMILEFAGLDVRLGFEPRERVLMIATADRLGRDLVVRVYDVRDLLIPLAAEVARENDTPLYVRWMDPTPSLVNLADPRFRERAARAATAPSANEEGEFVNPECLGEAEGVFLDMLRCTIEPDIWRETGGGDSSMRVMNGILIVSAPRSAQEKLSRMVSTLRSADFGAPDWTKRKR